jgi:hypothetical protein
VYKDELILIHQLLIYLMRFLTDIGASDSYFEGYKGLRISPHHIHRTKGEHKYAILLLAKGISEILSDKELAPINLSAGLEALAERCEEDVSRQKGY